MGTQGNFLYRPGYRAKGQAEFNLFDQGLAAVDTELYKRSKDLYMQGKIIYGSDVTGGNLLLKSNPLANGKICLGANFYYNELNEVVYKGGTRFIHNYGDPTAEGRNTFMGIGAGNLSMGPAGGDVWLGSNNSGFGWNSLLSLTTGYHNAAFGSGVLLYNTTGYRNSAFGNNALEANTIGFDNCAFGKNALSANISGVCNQAFGADCLSKNLGSYNSAFGRDSMYENLTGHDNSAFGVQALYINTIGSYNSAFGRNTLTNQTEGNNNSALGFEAGVLVTTGGNNVLLGYRAGKNLTVGSNNIIIGYDLAAAAIDSSNTINIGGIFLFDGTNIRLTPTGTGQVLIPDGNASQLGLAFTNDPDTGIYRIGSGDFTFRSNGGYAIRIESASKASFYTTMVTMNSLVLDRANEDVTISREGAKILGLDSTLSLAELASAPAVGANKARIYAIDNGAGKTQLMVLFPSGVAQQLAIEA